MIKFMKCTSCRAVVQVNNTGVCEGCQLGKGVGHLNRFITEEKKEKPRKKSGKRSQNASNEQLN